LVEVLLSDLVFARSPDDGAVDPQRRYYDFHPEARSVLMRSLRRADAESIASTLEAHVSRYLDQIHGRAVTFGALVADERGQFELPKSVQPFAQLGLSLLGAFARGLSAAQRVERFRASCSAEVVAAAVRLAADPSFAGVLDPAAIDPALWEAMSAAGLLRKGTDGEWGFLPGLEPLLARMSERGLDGARILWLDEHRQHNRPAIQRCLSLGAKVDFAERIGQALRMMQSEAYDVLVLVLTQATDAAAIDEQIRTLDDRGLLMKVVLYAVGIVGDAEHRYDRLRSDRIHWADTLKALLETIRQAIVRGGEDRERESRLAKALKAVGITAEAGVGRRPVDARRIATEVLESETDPSAALQKHLQLLLVFSAARIAEIAGLGADGVRAVSVVPSAAQGTMSSLIDGAWKSPIADAVSQRKAMRLAVGATRRPRPLRGEWHAEIRVVGGIS
jgi:hypothetical protein